LVEQWIEDPRVTSSNLVLGTLKNLEKLNKRIKTLIKNKNSNKKIKTIIKK
jgi:hypothetical protein